MIAAVNLGACSFDGDSGAEPDGGGVDGMTGADAGIIDDSPLFDPDHLLEVDITIASADWDSLRFQSRNVVEILGPDCGAAPAVSPFTYFSATVTVDGTELAEVGVRKKGFLGSLDDQKPSLKIKFNEFVPGQRLLGQKRMTLNNAVQDPSFVNQCLGYKLFNDADVPAPRCSFARVRLNGADLGVYVHVESVKKPFLRRHFDDDGGNLYEGTLSDFRAGWMATFEQKTNEISAPSRADLAAIEAALAKPDAAMLADIETLVDLPRFYRFWAVEAMVAHWDGYSGNNNNYFVYGDPSTDKMVFMPWGADQLFGDAGTTPNPAVTRSLLTRRLFVYAPSRAAYLAEYQQILDNVWDDDAMLGELDRYRAVFESSVTSARRTDYNTAIAALRANLAGRGQRMATGLAQTGAGDASDVSEPLCFDDIGDGTATFAADYDTGANASVSMSLTIDSADRGLANLGVFVGESTDEPGTAIVYILGEDSGGKDFVLLVGMPESMVAPGTIELGKGAVEAFLLFTPQGATEPDEIYLVSGALTLTAAGTQTGSPWNASVTIDTWRSPFFQ